MTDMLTGHGSLTREFAQMCASFTYKDMTDEAINKTRELLIDTIGVMLGAAHDGNPGYRVLLDWARHEQRGGAILTGSTETSSSTTAALVNGYLGYALDSDTVHRPGIMHSGAAIIPAALATLRPGVADGESLIAAIALGAEVASRVNMAVGPGSLYARGYHPTAFGAAFGGAAAGGLLLGITPECMEEVFGLAAMQAGGLLAWANDTSEQARPLSVGFGVRGGVTAAALGSQGFHGPKKIFDPDEKYNVYRTWSTNGHPEDATILAQPLTSCDAVRNVVYKRHGCCAFIHPAIDMLLDIMETEKIGDDDIAQVVMRFPTAGVDVINDNPLRSHSAQYVLTLAAALGYVDFEDVLADRLNQMGTTARLGRVALIGDTELDPEFPATRATILEVSVRGRDTIRRKLVYPRGAPENPFSTSELRSKFMRMATKRLEPDRATELLQWLEGVPDVDDAYEIGALLGGGSLASAGR